jgi:hypothetical protein
MRRKRAARRASFAHRDGSALQSRNCARRPLVASLNGRCEKGLLRSKAATAVMHEISHAVMSTAAVRASVL